jgi:hypothetical protein
VIHVRFLVVVVVHHIARVARKFISFRNNQNLEALFVEMREIRVVMKDEATRIKRAETEKLNEDTLI